MKRKPNIKNPYNTKTLILGAKVVKGIWALVSLVGRPTP